MEIEALVREILGAHRRPKAGGPPCARAVAVREWVEGAPGAVSGALVERSKGRLSRRVVSACKARGSRAIEAWATASVRTEKEIVTMKISLFLGAFSCSLILSAGAPAVHAFDLTGNWTGKWSCKGFDGVKFKSGNKNSTMAITQTGTTIAANIDAGDFLFNGIAIFDTSKPAVKGEAVLIQCGTDNLPGAGADGEIARATAKTKIDSAKATFKALSIFEDAFPEGGTCKYSYKRQDPNDPNVAACP
jgi:hypothetical protein